MKHFGARVVPCGRAAGLSPGTNGELRGGGCGGEFPFWLVKVVLWGASEGVGARLRPPSLPAGPLSLVHTAATHVEQERGPEAAVLRLRYS